VSVRDETVRLGIIGGSGLYEVGGVEDRREVEVSTPFGKPSGTVVTGTLGGVRMAFIARHGEGHRFLPTEVNFRANIFALKRLGAEFLLSASSVGSLREDVHPLDVVVADQFIDRTRHRTDTFFGDGLVAHVSLADPVCATLAGAAADAVEKAGARVHRAGTYVCMEGPQFSTRAESELYRSWRASVVGMTNLQEARLAREAEICYATLCFVTDYDCWKTDEPPVTVGAVVERLKRNAETARQAVANIAGLLPRTRDCICATALDAAMITRPDVVPQETIERLGPLMERALSRRS
jgi:5'-methylthioadenosine phosphorylase